MTGIHSIVRSIFSLLNLLILVRVILSWVRPNVNDPTWRKVLRIIFNITEPILAPIRQLLPMNWGIDFSPIIAIFALNIIESFILRIL